MLPLIIAALTSLPAAAQERGSLLVATDRLSGEAFAETVVLLLHAGDDGAIGVAVNRPTWVTTQELLPEHEALHAYRGRVYHGGPLAQSTVLVLRRGEPSEADDEPLVDDVYMTSDLDALEAGFETSDGDGVLRFYAGHASWRPGQLEEEIDAGAWRVIPGSAAAIFDEQPLSLWSRLAGPGTQLSVRRAPARAEPGGAFADTR